MNCEMRTGFVYNPGVSRITLETKIKAIAMVACFIGGYSGSLGAGPKPLRPMINSFHTRLAKTMVKRDFVAFDQVMKSVCSPDFKYIEGSRAIPLDQLVKGLKMALGSFKSISKVTFTSQSLKVTGKTAINQIDEHITATMADQSGKIHDYDIEGKFAEKFIKTKSDWKMTEYKAISTSVKVDGKSMGTPAPPTQPKT